MPQNPYDRIANVLRHETEEHSSWFIRTLRDATHLDCVDAANEAEYLAELLADLADKVNQKYASMEGVEQ